jgi:tetratricopeptide (TPR) repeat protein
MKKINFILLFLLVLCSHLPAQETAEELYNKAMEHKKNNNCKEALELLEKATILKPGFGEAWFEAGWCHNELNNPIAAISNLEKSATLLKNDFRVNYELGHAFFSLDSVSSSLKYFRESIRLKSDYHLSYVGMGDIYRDKLENTSEALNWYLKAYAIDSTHKKTNYWIGWCYNDLEKYSKAIPYLEKVIADDPANMVTVIELGFSLYSIGKYEQALSILQKTLLLQPKPELAVYYTGLCYVKTVNKTEAVNSYNDLVILNSKYALELLAEIKKMN